MNYDQLVDDCIEQDAMRQVTPEFKKSKSSWLSLIIFIGVLLIVVVIAFFILKKTVIPI